MAKKSAAKNKKPAKGKKPKAKGRGDKKLRQPVLKGANLEQIRNARLDRFCEDIFDAREKMNDGKDEERGAIQGALKEMQTKRITSYTAHGVRLLFAHGEDKLSVKIIDKEGASGGGGRSADAGAGAGDTGGEPATPARAARPSREDAELGDDELDDMSGRG